MLHDSLHSSVSTFGDLVEKNLASVAGNHPYIKDSHNALMKSIRAYRAALKHFHSVIEKEHYHGLSGKLICAKLSVLIDRLIMHTYENSTSADKGGSEFAITALGGYGRNELNPYSDIDLLFLSKKPFKKCRTDPLKKSLLFLWDVNLDLGHSTHTIDECLEAAGNDDHLATSLLEARFLTGNLSIWEEFKTAYADWLHNGAGKQLAMLKIKERIQRLNFFHGTVHIQEPNIKECPGTLRDIHTTRWLLLLDDPESSLSGESDSDLLSVKEKEIYNKGLDFLLRIRNSLHFLAAGKADIINHEILPDVAKQLGYRGAGVSPTEKFMRDYYKIAGEIRQLTDRVADDMIERLSPSEHHEFIRVSQDILANDRSVALSDTLIESETITPHVMIQFFAVAGARRAKPTRSTSSYIEEIARLSGPEYFETPEAALAFHKLMNMREGISHALRLMNEHGILVKLLPEFEAICWHYQYDFYHAYTTDEHSLRVVENLENMATGISAKPELSVLMEDVTAKSALYLAGLLHDIGKAGGAGHAQRGERRAARALRRLGFDERTIDIVRFLIREHLLMSHISQRRDIEDEDTIDDFIGRVNSARRLRMLTLLTFADLMALSDNALTDWKRTLLLNLYKKGQILIDKDFENTYHRVHENKVKKFMKILNSSFSHTLVKQHINNLPEYYIRNTPGAIINHHIHGIERMKKRGAWASFLRTGELSRLTVIAPDHPKALSDICGTITSADISIVRAQIFTRDDGIIIDTFHVISGNGAAVISPEYQTQFKKNLPKVLAGQLDVRELITSHIKQWRRRKKNVVYYPPRVKFHNNISTKYTVVDVFAADYTGLLYDITSVFAGNGIDIHTARIGTDEDQVADAFYIRKDGRKIEDEKTIDRLTGEIIGRLTEAHR